MTSKEQAEHYLNEVERLFFQTHGMDDGAALRKAVRESIPLTELLEVAKASVESQRLAAVFNDEDIELEKALSALRATNKIKEL